MSPDERELLVAAQDSLDAAKLLLREGYPGFAASRAYYAMFYVAQTFLERAGMSFSKHSAVIAAFGRHFAQTGKVPIEYHRFLMEAQELRQGGDYGPRGAVSASQAEEVIGRAERFLETAYQEIGRL